MATPVSILIVDDEEWLAAHNSRVLRREGYQVSVVHNALQAIEAVDRSLPDVMVLDLFMPGANGVALLHEMRSYNDLQAVPVILCTNNAAELGDNDLRAYGVRGILDKTSMRPYDLVKSVRSVLS